MRCTSAGSFGPEPAMSESGLVTDHFWPTLPQRYESTVEPGEPSSGTEFTLIVEQTEGSGNTMRWLAVPVTRTTWDERERARAEALRYAWSFQPRHPMNEQRRSVYRVSPDEYLVIIEGATMTFSLRIIVAEPLGYRSSDR